MILSELLVRHHRQVARLVRKSLTAIEEAFEANRILPARDADGDAVTLDGGQDHFARLTAAKRVLELLEAARPGAHQASSGATITWEMFLQLRQSQVEARTA